MAAVVPISQPRRSANASIAWVAAASPIYIGHEDLAGTVHLTLPAEALVFRDQAIRREVRREWDRRAFAVRPRRITLGGQPRVHRDPADPPRRAVSTPVHCSIGNDTRANPLADVDDQGVPETQAATNLELGERGEVIVLRHDHLAAEVAAELDAKLESLPEMMHRGAHDRAFGLGHSRDPDANGHEGLRAHRALALQVGHHLLEAAWQVALDRRRRMRQSCEEDSVEVGQHGPAGLVADVDPDDVADLTVEPVHGRGTADPVWRHCRALV